MDTVLEDCTINEFVPRDHSLLGQEPDLQMAWYIQRPIWRDDNSDRLEEFIYKMGGRLAKIVNSLWKVTFWSWISSMGKQLCCIHIEISIIMCTWRRHLCFQSYSELSELYTKYWTAKNISQKTPVLFRSLYDAVWTAALALDSAISATGINADLEHFTYKDKDMASHLFDKLTQIEFYGAKVRLEKYCNLVF